MFLVRARPSDDVKGDEEDGKGDEEDGPEARIVRPADDGRDGFDIESIGQQLQWGRHQEYYLADWTRALRASMDAVRVLDIRGGVQLTRVKQHALVLQFSRDGTQHIAVIQKMEHIRVTDNRLVCLIETDGVRVHHSSRANQIWGSSPDDPYVLLPYRQTFMAFLTIPDRVPAVVEQLKGTLIVRGMDFSRPQLKWDFTLTGAHRGGFQFQHGGEVLCLMEPDRVAAVAAPVV